jgi:hypothetical protein
VGGILSGLSQSHMAGKCELETVESPDIKEFAATAILWPAMIGWAVFAPPLKPTECPQEADQ